jgi:hypothetical protein
MAPLTKKSLQRMTFRSFSGRGNECSEGIAWRVARIQALQQFSAAHPELPRASGHVGADRIGDQQVGQLPEQFFSRLVAIQKRHQCMCQQCLS